VAKGQIVEVEISATAPVVGDKFNYSALLLVQGDSWGPPLAVRLSLARGHVDIVPQNDAVILNLGQGHVDFTLRSVTGAGTFVIFETAGWATDANVTISGKSSFGIAGQLAAPNTLLFQSGPANPNSSGFFHLAATAFNDSENKQHELFVFKVAGSG
jgi:hypothetical protein